MQLAPGLGFNWSVTFAHVEWGQMLLARRLFEMCANAGL
jgi:hypothetical protein